jgi:hypothetical protein
VEGGVKLVPLDTEATNTPIMSVPGDMMEKLVKWLAGEIEVLGENLPQCRFVDHKPHMLPGREQDSNVAINPMQCNKVPRVLGHITLT